jgi:hypothetical protein
MTTYAPPAEPDLPAADPPVPDLPDLAAHPADAVGAVGRLATILGVVVAPTTLLTSVLLFFGRSHAHFYFDYFGVDSSVLGLTSQDYVIRSIDGLFVPLVVVASAGLLGLWGHALLRHRVEAARVHTGLRRTVTVVGVALTAAGLASVVATTPLSSHVAAAPVSLTVGVLLLLYGGHLRATGRPVGGQGDRSPRRMLPPRVVLARWAGVFVLIGMSLFWAASDYSAAVGRTQARHTVADLPTRADVVVYTDKSLSLHAPGVTEVRCQEAEARYRFRYDGLKLILRSGDQYLFLPRDWSPTEGAAILVPRSDALRLEFARGSQASASAARPTC